MAEAAVVSTLMQTLNSMLADKLLQEVSLATSFKNDFEFICDELVSIKMLLNDAGKKRNTRSMSNWLDKLEDFLYDALDMVKECGVVRRFGNPIFRYRMGCKIRGLKDRIIKIHKSAKYLKHLTCVLDLNAFNEENAEDKRERSSVFLKEIQHVGIDNGIEQITDLILSEEDCHQVIAVLGMGGMGKTFLVQHVFKSQKVEQCFDYMVWLALSPSFMVKQLLVEMCRQIKLPVPSDEIQGSGAEDLVTEIHEYLKEARCLFVLDDVWERDVWSKIGLPFQNKYNIVITARHKKVVESLPRYHIHYMVELSYENSMKLFCIHAFPDSEENSPPEELTSLAQEIVKKCSGLPLAVKTIGASMTRVRRIPNDWESTLNRLNEAEAMNGRVMPSLRLSYEDLPYHLKLCFLYCSAFPKNTRMKSEYLVHAWIDEGFSPETGEEAYDLARSYMDELIDRCLIEVLKVGGDGQVKYCKMHDLFHDLALSEFHKRTKCLIKPGEKIKEFPVGDCVGLRRISLVKNDISTINEAIQCPGLRTLLLWNTTSLESISASFFNNLKYLAVLDLSETSIHLLPESIGHLQHLTFLNLSRTKIKKLPKSFRNLRSLEFLDVSWCEHLCELHSGIGEHKSILHLNVKGSKKLESLPVGISKLIYLHTLKGTVFKREKAANAKGLQLSNVLKRKKLANSRALQLKDLKELTVLQRLSLTLDSASSQDIAHLEEGVFHGMTKMRAFSFKYINSLNDAGLLHLPKDVEVMKRLEIIHLSGCVVDKWIFQLQNLMELELNGDNGSAADYKGLEKIPNLQKLTLSLNQKCVGFPMEFGEPGAFPKLEKLIIKSFNCLEYLPLLQDEAMPLLKCLQMKYCKQLKDMTQALQLRNGTLEEIKVKCCPSWEALIWNGKDTWQLLKYHSKRLIINGYTVCWDIDQLKNLRLYNENNYEGKLKKAIQHFAIEYP